ncbi:hypothetical protein TcWFU_000044 [Taenia crassiceps]|uniref:Transmembrane protein n=1 Tax=Taenia crassiceps TaxID=6207 RepID=A0ABR4Q1S8_9CEST
MLFIDVIGISVGCKQAAVNATAQVAEVQALWTAFVSGSNSKMRTWILCALAVVALVACFQLAEAKPAVTIDRAPHDLEVGGGGDKEIESRPRRQRRKKNGKHSPGRGKVNQHRQKPKRRRFKKPRSVEDDRKRGKKCANAQLCIFCFGTRKGHFLRW